MEEHGEGSFCRRDGIAFRCFDFLCNITQSGFGVIVIFGRWGLEGFVFVSCEGGICCPSDSANVAISCGDNDWNSSCSSIRYVVWYTICVWMSLRSLWVFGGRVVSSFLYGHNPIKSDCNLDGSSGVWWLVSQSARVERSWEIFFGVFGRMLVMSVSKC